MADTSGPWDGSPWSEAQWYRHAAMWAPSGVYGGRAASASAGDLPLTISGLNWTLGAGRAVVRGGGFERTGSASGAAITANTHATQFRRDRLVLRRSLSTHTVAPVRIQGTPASTPANPAITQNEAGDWDLPLYSWLVPPNSGTSITDVLDERGFLADGASCPDYVSVRARDAAIASPGDNLWCSVAGIPQVYRSGAWHGLAPQLLSTAVVDTGLKTGNATLMTLSVPDPGFPYKLQCSGQIIFAVVGAGVTAGGRIRVNGTDLMVGNDALNLTGSDANNLLTTVPPGVTGSLTGASTVTIFVSKTGPSGNGYQAGSSGGLGLYNTLNALVVPA